MPHGFDPAKLLSCLEYKAAAGDIFIDTFPKCGTNWTKRIVQLLIGENSAQESDYGLSTSFFEMVGKDTIAALPEPRIITSHLPYELLPKHPQAKYIYVVRNPKDCCVSYFHHTKKDQAVPLRGWDVRRVPAALHRRADELWGLFQAPRLVVPSY